MPLVQLFHNPTAGDEEHSKKKLLKTIEAQGFACRYSSTKDKGWQQIEPEADFIVLAGGDGTVRKVAAELLHRKLLEKQYPIALLPLGTANNIARTLGLKGNALDLTKSWWKGQTKPFDIGIAQGLEEHSFFLEGFGYGLFPRLMKAMKTEESKEKGEEETPEEQMLRALQVLHELVQDYEPRHCRVEIDGVDFSGEYLLVEVMNIRSIGPTLLLAPEADPGDGYLDVVLLTKDDREAFANYLQTRIQGEKNPFEGQTHRGCHVVLQWEGAAAHLDDECIRLKKATEVKIEVKKGVLEFIVSDQEA